MEKSEDLMKKSKDQIPGDQMKKFQDQKSELGEKIR